jgi:hypothetical protein
MAQKELLTKKDYAAIGEEISLETATDFVTAYEQAFPGDINRYTVGRKIIDEILAQPGCMGLRFYNAMNEAGKKTLVYVGIDADGKDLVKRTVVLEDGRLAAGGIVADRLDGGIWEWIFGK